VSTENEQDEFIRNKILHILSIYPKVSPGMIQVTLGAGVPARWWKAVLENMIEDGTLSRDSQFATGPGGRERNYIVIHKTEPNRHDVLRHGQGSPASLESDDRGPAKVGANA
jgi:hypothetical protein